MKKYNYFHIYKFLYLNMIFEQVFDFQSKKNKIARQCKQIQRTNYVIFKNCYCFLISNYEDFPSRKFISWSPALLRWRIYQHCGPCKMPNPSGCEAGKTSWRSSWTSNTSDRNCGVDKDSDICICNTLIAILSLNSPVVKKSGQSTWQILMISKDAEFNTLRFFLKNISKNPKAECSLGPSASFYDLGTEAVSLPILNAKVSLSFYFIKDHCSKESVKIH